MLLRKDILHMSKHQEELPETLSAESLHRGQGHIPETQFFTVLYTGSDQQPYIEKIKRLVQSVSQDVIYAKTRGRTKPGKHLTLGLGLKSMTGSRTAIEVLNRHGHCIGYHTAEIIETDLAPQIVNRQNATQDGLLQHSGLCTIMMSVQKHCQMQGPSMTLLEFAIKMKLIWVLRLMPLPMTA